MYLVWVRRARLLEAREEEEAELQRQRVEERLASGNFSRQPSGFRRAINGMRVSGRHKVARSTEPEPLQAPTAGAEDTREH